MSKNYGSRKSLLGTVWCQHYCLWIYSFLAMSWVELWVSLSFLLSFPVSVSAKWSAKLHKHSSAIKYLLIISINFQLRPKICTQCTCAPFILVLLIVGRTPDDYLRVVDLWVWTSFLCPSSPLSHNLPYCSCVNSQRT